MTTMSVTEARAALPELLDRVTKGDEVTITRHGTPVAVVVRPDNLRRRRADKAFAGAEEIRARLAAAEDIPFSEIAIDSTFAEELLAEIRAGRDG